jgi:hypothetical protein
MASLDFGKTPHLLVVSVRGGSVAATPNEVFIFKLEHDLRCLKEHTKLELLLVDARRRQQTLTAGPTEELRRFDRWYTIAQLSEQDWCKYAESDAGRCADDKLRHFLQQGYATGQSSLLCFLIGSGINMGLQVELQPSDVQETPAHTRTYRWRATSDGTVYTITSDSLYSTAKAMHQEVTETAGAEVREVELYIQVLSARAAILYGYSRETYLDLVYGADDEKLQDHDQPPTVVKLLQVTTRLLGEEEAQWPHVPTQPVDLAHIAVDSWNSLLAAYPTFT